ncbi:hypothetical protein KY346_03030 [Candidatus Woesearchaeota archaeon]|nr:hypothetical protein [Candidatus Woesearchaeota archaeon]
MVLKNPWFLTNLVCRRHLVHNTAQHWLMHSTLRSASIIAYVQIYDKWNIA